MIDVAIIGAGPVGAALAASIAPLGVAVEVFESRAAPATDSRVLALSHASVEQLKELGAWPGPRATAIESIHVSQKGGPGRTLIEARDAGLPALGHTVSLADLESALHARLAALGVALHYGQACERISLAEDAATIGFASGREAEARLLVLADGGANATRIPGIAFNEKDYGQRALVGSVATDRAHAGRAYERFTSQGPAALLPYGDRYALVWTATPEEAGRLAALEEPAFLARLQAHFGDRAGRFVSVADRASFPLRLRTVNVPVALRTVIVGSAAQALHPIAGQGLNLGLRDARDLAACIAARGTAGVGEAGALAAYRDVRRRDATRGVAFTDFLVSAFGFDGTLARLGRGLALTALDVFPPARRALASRMIYGPGS